MLVSLLEQASGFVHPADEVAFQTTLKIHGPLRFPGCVLPKTLDERCTSEYGHKTRQRN